MQNINLIHSSEPRLAKVQTFISNAFKKCTPEFGSAALMLQVGIHLGTRRRNDDITTNKTVIQIAAKAGLAIEEKHAERLWEILQCFHCGRYNKDAARFEWSSEIQTSGFWYEAVLPFI